MDDEAVDDCRSVTSPLDVARGVALDDAGIPDIFPLRGLVQRDTPWTLRCAVIGVFSGMAGAGGYLFIYTPIFTVKKLQSLRLRNFIPSSRRRADGNTRSSGERRPRYGLAGCNKPLVGFSQPLERVRALGFA